MPLYTSATFARNPGQGDSLPAFKSIGVAMSAAARGILVIPLYRRTRYGCCCGLGEYCESPGAHPVNGLTRSDASSDPAVVFEWFLADADAVPGTLTSSGFRPIADDHAGLLDEHEDAAEPIGQLELPLIGTSEAA